MPTPNDSGLEKEKSPEVDEFELELAKRFAAASISIHARMGLEYAYKRYTREADDIGIFWIELARLAIKHHLSRPI
jgi:hypothetical protein